MKRLSLGNGRFNRSVAHRGWQRVYPQFAARMDARASFDATYEMVK